MCYASTLVRRYSQPRTFRRVAENSLLCFLINRIPQLGREQSIAPESALKRLQEINASRHTEELANLHAAMEREKEERLKRLQEERTK